jgi:hypothetical protein
VLDAHVPVKIAGSTPAIEQPEDVQRGLVVLTQLPMHALQDVDLAGA